MKNVTYKFMNYVNEYIKAQVQTNVTDSVTKLSFVTNCGPNYTKIYTYTYKDNINIIMT